MFVYKKILNKEKNNKKVSKKWQHIVTSSTFFYDHWSYWKHRSYWTFRFYRSYWKGEPIELSQFKFGKDIQVHQVQIMNWTVARKSISFVQTVSLDLVAAELEVDSSIWGLLLCVLSDHTESKVVLQFVFVVERNEDTDHAAEVALVIRNGQITCLFKTEIY